MRVILLTVFILFASVAHAGGGPAWHPLAKEDASDRAPRFVAASRTDGVRVDLSLPGFFNQNNGLERMLFHCDTGRSGMEVVQVLDFHGYPLPKCVEDSDKRI